MDRGRESRYGQNRDGSRPFRSPQRDDPRGSYRSYRSPPPRDRSPSSYRSSYAPRDDRRRSRSPAYSGRNGSSGYGARARSPPPRRFSPRREPRPRSPPRRSRRYSRSPVKRRSPPPSSRQDSPPYSRRPRSPPFAKHPRSPPPRSRYEDRKDNSPPRNTRPRFPNENNYRPGEGDRNSPPRRSNHHSRATSPISSRRSSPAVHPDRLANTISRSPGYQSNRPAPRENGHRDRSPPSRKSYPTNTSPPSDPAAYRQRSPPPRQPSDYRDPTGPAGPPSAPRAEESRPTPPRGPMRSLYDRGSPSGPPSAPMSMSAHSRPGNNPLLTAPTQPRGGPAFGRGDSRGSSFAGRGGRPTPYEGYHERDSRAPSSDYIPAGPRFQRGGASAPSYDSTPRHAPPFRPNNSTSTTYPRTLRFNSMGINHLASLPSIIPGGKALPSMDPTADKKISQLEDEAKKLREQIDARQKEKRAGLREWESRERESRRDGLRSELAEQQLQGLSGEVIGGQAF